MSTIAQKIHNHDASVRKHSYMPRSSMRSPAAAPVCAAIQRAAPPACKTDHHLGVPKACTPGNERREQLREHHRSMKPNQEMPNSDDVSLNAQPCTISFYMSTGYVKFGHVHLHVARNHRRSNANKRKKLSFQTSATNKEEV